VVKHTCGKRRDYVKSRNIEGNNERKVTGEGDGVLR